MSTPPPDSEVRRGIFLSWTVGNARTADLAKLLNLEPVFVCIAGQRAMTAPFRWLGQGVLSVPALLSRNLSVIVLMMPPYPALLLCRVVARIRRVPLVIDAHSAVFEDPWWKRFLPLTLKHLERSALTVVTNARHRMLLEAHNIQVVELHDPPAAFTPAGRPKAEGHVLVPASWHRDEPLTEISHAARLLPDVSFVITGQPAPVVLNAMKPLPANVYLSGFVSDKDYASLLTDASMVCCITLNDNTMQRGGYEALAKGLPLVTSNFAPLRDYFGAAAGYAEATADSIATQIQHILEDHEAYAGRMSALREEIAVRYDDLLVTVRKVIEQA